MYKPSGDPQGQVSDVDTRRSLTAEMALKDPEARLAAELVLRYHTLHEQFPDAPTLAQSRKRAQSGRRLWPHQLLDGN